MNLLQVNNLTLRFGGLTAVKNVSLEVREKEIVSIIGPNGAGKTTVFNAITGIYEPTSGEILFRNKTIVKPWTAAVTCWAIFAGFLTALAGLLLGLNIDLLWKSSIQRTNYVHMYYANKESSEHPLARKFTYAEAWRNVCDYANGNLSVQLSSKGKSWEVTSSDGLTRFKRFPTESEALAWKDKLQSIYHGSRTVTVANNHRATILTPKGESLGDFSGEEAQEIYEKLIEIRQRHSQRSRLATMGCLLGFIVGCAGYLVVWNRSRRTPDVISLGGIARTFQNIRLFPQLTVLENVLVGMDRTFSSNLLGMIFRWPSVTREARTRSRQALELLQFMGLTARANDLAKNLPYGDQRRLEIARALATQPQLLLLDEPAAGMNPSESADLMELIRSIRERGVTILLIEHHMKLVMGISDRIYVLEYGAEIAHGTPQEVRSNPKVIEAYLGKEEDH